MKILSDRALRGGTDRGSVESILLKRSWQVMQRRPQITARWEIVVAAVNVANLTQGPWPQVARLLDGRSVADRADTGERSGTTDLPVFFIE